MSEATTPQYRADVKDRGRDDRLISTAEGILEKKDRDVYNVISVRHCQNFWDAFSKCSKENSFTVIWKCRDLLATANQCMQDYAKSHPFEEYHAKRNAQREEEARAKLNATKAAESHQQ